MVGERNWEMLYIRSSIHTIKISRGMLALHASQHDCRSALNTYRHYMEMFQERGREREKERGREGEKERRREREERGREGDREGSRSGHVN